MAGSASGFELSSTHAISVALDKLTKLKSPTVTFKDIDGDGALDVVLLSSRNQVPALIYRNVGYLTLTLTQL